MKSIIEATIAHFACKSCNGKITDRDVQILGTSGQLVNMEVMCPHCKTPGMIKAEINVMGSLGEIGQMQEMGISPAAIFQMDTPSSPAASAINDTDILALREKLKNTASIEDLLS